MDSNQYTIIGLGEILWDLLPEGKHPGGAPANFAYHAASLGNRGIIASRVGTDTLGQQALSHLKQLDLTTAYVQTDTTYPTGTVRVQVDEQGQPDFTIRENVAWDYLEWTPLWQELAAQADAVCFGTLAQRSPHSRYTIRRFLQATRSNTLRIFDVNLRQSFYSTEVLAESLNLAKMVKLNDDELPEVMNTLGLKSGNARICARRLIDDYQLKLVCVTRGERGSLLITEAEIVEHSGFRITVADTVGAGDAFTAALAHYYLRNASLEKISEAANRLGAWVAAQVGATPAIDRQVT